MKIVIIICVEFLLSSCMSKNSLIRAKFQPIKKGYKLVYHIQNKYKLFKIDGGHEHSEYNYLYFDSSMFYVADLNGWGGLNYDNIIRQDGSFSKLLEMRLRSNAGHFSKNDTLTIEGLDDKGLFWKHIFYRGFHLGYLKVSKDKKKSFDTALKTVKIKCFGHKRVFLHFCKCIK